MMGLLNRKPKTTQEQREETDYQEDKEEAFRIAGQMQSLAADLLDKAHKLQEELQRGH